MTRPPEAPEPPEPRRRISLDTLLAQAGYAPDPATGAVVPPLVSSATFARGADYELPGEFLYARYGSPTVRHAEGLLAELDGGADAMLFGSGMAAATTVFETLARNDEIVAARIMYHGAQNWLHRIAERRGVVLTLFDAARDGALEEAVTPGRTRLVWVESPVNPTWDVVDIARAAEIAHAAGARLAVDSTVAPPVTTRPIELGADLVFHSATKYLNGHSDLTAGVLVTRAADDRWADFEQLRTLMGNVIGAFEAWLLIRGLRTLGLRFARASGSALRIARHFESHPAVEAVLYPGLESHPGHAVAARQMTGGFGGMLSLLIAGDAGEAAARAKAIAAATSVFTPATSLGGVESLIEHRASVEGPHSVVPANLLRLSVGIEDPDDLIADLKAALGGEAQATP
ncbi:MAG: trans-sulfuration enzyme family protein [Gemmatimonadota bacterium]